MKRKHHPLPFPMEVNLYPTSDKIKLYVDLKGSDAEKHLEYAGEMLSFFITAANAGMFCMPNQSPVNNYMKILSHHNVKGELNINYESQGIDLQSFRILLSCLSQTHYKLEPLEVVRISSSPQNERCLNSDTIMTCPFPAKIANVPFQLSIREPEKGDALIQLRFNRTISEDDFEEINTTVTAWDNLAMLGGYSDAWEAIESFPFVPGDLYLLDLYTVEHTILRYDGPRDVFNAIVNMAVKFHSKFSSLVSLEIE